MLKLRTEIQEYEDLQIQIRRQSRNEGLVIITPPEGEPLEGPVTINLTRDEVEKILASNVRAGEMRVKRSGAFDRPDPIRELGGYLFSILFEGRRLSHYHRALDRVTTVGNGLRLRLVVEDPEWDTLPWEFLHDGREFIGLSSRTPVMRVLLRPIAPQPLAATSRLRVLVATANLVGEPEFDSEFNSSVQRLLSLLQTSSSQTEVTLLSDATPREVQDAVRDQDFQILHYFGNGIKTARDGQVLTFMAEDRAPTPSVTDLRAEQLVSATRLGAMLKDEPKVRLVFLCACDTDQLAGALARYSPAVLGMRGRITIRACTVFMEAVYRAILEHQSLVEAVAAGRQEIDLQYPGSREWGLPVFYSADSAFKLLARPSQAHEFQAPTEGFIQDDILAPPEDPGRRREWKKLTMMLELHQRNLRALEEQTVGLKGPAPPIVESQIQDTKAQIADLTEQLKALQ